MANEKSFGCRNDRDAFWLLIAASQLDRSSQVQRTASNCYGGKVMEAKKILENAQAIGVLSSLVVVLGKAEQYKQQLGSPILCRVALADPQSTATLVNFDLIAPILMQRAQALISELAARDIDTSSMMQEIEEQLEKSKQPS